MIRIGALAVLLAGCRDAADVRAALGVGTARERYERRLRDAGLDGTAAGARWLAAGDSAAGAAALVGTPFREAGYFAGTDARAVAYRWPMRRGQRALVIVAAEGDTAGGGGQASSTPLFVDVFHRDSSGALDRAASLDAASGTLNVEAERDGELVVRLQPELLRAVRYVLTVRVAPLATAFPVAGRSERAAQSFWGATRDGGRRAHQGVDIFAPRGTPVLAAMPGIVTSVGENRLGGRVVWVVEPRRRWAFYYAHLDAQLTREGAHVQPGDTLGTVGNTGNASGTAPHLHFGVYRTGRRGAVDPWPFLFQPRGEPADVRAELTLLGERRRLTTSGAVGTLVAARGARYVVRLADGTVAEESPARLAALTPLRRLAPRGGAPLHARPTAQALVLARVGPGERPALLGRSADWCLVEAARGTGWIDCAAE